MLQYLHLFNKQEQIQTKPILKFEERSFNSLEKFMFDIDSYDHSKQHLELIKANIIADMNQSQITWDGLPFKETVDINEFNEKYNKFCEVSEDLNFLIKFLENNEKNDIFEKCVNDNDINVSKKKMKLNQKFCTEKYL